MRPPHLAAMTLFACIGVLPMACNVFVTVASCEADDDCPSGFVCDPGGRFCLDRRAVTAVDASQAPADASPAPADARVVDAGSDVGVDAAIDAEAGSPCDLTKPFGSPTLVFGLEGVTVNSARFTPDEKTVLFSAQQPGCSEERCADTFYALRGDSSAPFLVSGPLPGTNVNTDSASEYWPTMTGDGLLLFFESARSLTKLPDGGYTNDQSRIWTATRSNLIANFSEPYIQTPFKNIAEPEGAPYLNPNGRSLYFVSFGRSSKGSLDLFVATLDELGGASTIVNIDAVNTTKAESAPVVTLDEKVLYFAREDAAQWRRILQSKRPSPSALFEAPQPVPELSSVVAGQEEYPCWVSEDQCRLYFVSNRPAPNDAGAESRLWVAEHPR
jgi:hypothetical protein